MGVVRDSLCVLGLSVVVSGCLTTAPSREPPVAKLKVDVETGEFEHDDVTSQGDFIAKGTKVTIFNGFFADGALVDEVTLYHLAGDTEHRDDVIAYNKQYNRAVMAGWGGSALGLAVIAAGGTMFAVLGGDDPEAFFVSNEGQIAVGLMTVGGLVLAGAPIASATVLMPDQSRSSEGNTHGFNAELVFPLGTASDAVMSFEARRDAPVDTPVEAPPSG